MSERWTLEYDNDGNGSYRQWHYIVANDDERIGEIYLPRQHSGEEYDAATRRALLAAKAPVMLEALQGLVDRITVVPVPGTEDVLCMYCETKATPPLVHPFDCPVTKARTALEDTDGRDT